MTPTLLFAIACMILALTCYSIGVWGEKLSGKLKRWHLVFFWLGLAADTSGTTLMSVISGAFTFSIHGVTGIAAILLMVIHAIWATIVLIRRKERASLSFHKFSIFVWSVWLIPFLTGLVLAMKG